LIVGKKYKEIKCPIVAINLYTYFLICSINITMIVLIVYDISLFLL